MECPKDIKPNLIRHKRIRRRHRRHPNRPQDEDEPLPVQVRNPPPEQQEAAKGQRVRRDDPLLAAVGDGQVVADGGQDDDDALEGEGLQVLVSFLQSRCDILRGFNLH